MLFRVPVFFSLVICFSLVACGPKAPSDEGLNVWVSILPQKSIVEELIGERGSVQLMVRPGQSPETYSPSVPQMAALAKADLYFGVGMPLERVILAKLERSMPNLSFVQTAELMHAGHGHDHADHAGCAHGEEDPHVWMDPVWLRGFVAQVGRALSEIDPEGADLYEANAARLEKDLSELDEALRSELAPYAGRRFYINHPSLGHFAERYGLVQKTIEHSGSAPSAKQIAELVASAKSDQVGAIFTQPEFGQSSANVLARALGVEVVEVDVLSGDYYNNMRQIARSLIESFNP